MVYEMHGLETATDITAVQYGVNEWLVIIAQSLKIFSLARSLKIFSLARSLTYQLILFFRLRASERVTFSARERERCPPLVYSLAFLLTYFCFHGNFKMPFFYFAFEETHKEV